MSGGVYDPTSSTPEEDAFWERAERWADRLTTPHSVDELRVIVTDGINGALNRPIVWRFIGRDQAAVMKAVALVAARTDPAATQFLQAVLEQVPNCYAQPKEIEMAETTSEAAPAFLEKALTGVTLPFDWRAVLKQVGLAALLALLKFFDVQITLPAKAAGCPGDNCDHCACAADVLGATYKAFRAAASHYAGCCRDAYGC